MPRVHFVKSARKDNPVAKKGESYYWWQFYRSGKSYSKTRPRQSQLTRSAYFGTLYSLQEMIEDTEVTDNDDFTALRDEVASELDNLRDETQSSLDNMAEYNLEYSPTGELLQERVDACENAQMEVEGAEEFDEEEPDIDDFDQDCPDCDGTGDNPDYDPDDEDDDKECGTCTGTGEGVIPDEYHEAVDDYNQKLEDFLSSCKDDLIEKVGEAII